MISRNWKEQTLLVSQQHVLLRRVVDKRVTRGENKLLWQLELSCSLSTNAQYHIRENRQKGSG